ncbi:unnamed protein product [Symbiodinium microadriaticum]|nr:unnamed protein product [Symbiodinium microadriaticum]
MSTDVATASLWGCGFGYPVEILVHGKTGQLAQLARFKALVLAFHMEESEAVKEILLAGDANRLVAELTFVRINDLAAPPDKIVLLYLEPVVALTIGFQSSDDYQDWPDFLIVLALGVSEGFALVLILECCLRNFVGGCRNYFCGVERLELLRVDSGAAPLADAMFFTTLLRFVRLVRLTRIVKVEGLVLIHPLMISWISDRKDYELHALFENLPVQPGYEGRILLCALIPVLLSALRQAQEGEHANTVLQAHESGHESKWTQCCVTKNTGSLKIQSRAFRREAERILQDITYTGAYGPSDAFHTGRYVKHCRLALQLESCPGVHKTLFDLYEYADAGELITRIETFVAKYTFQSESYVWSAPDCPYKMESATDAGRCNSDLGHFMKLLDLWREGLRLVEQVNLYKGWRGYFKDKKTKALAKKQLDNVLARLETLWSMFTAFRCFTGQCETIEGAPLAAVLGKELFGSAGIFNVILAVYVDITMRAAKENEATTAEQHARESVRIARTTRELLKRFAAANKIFRDREAEGLEVRSRFDLDLSPQSAHFTDQAMQDEIEITKALSVRHLRQRCMQFKSIGHSELQHRSVGMVSDGCEYQCSRQGLMDDLDLPADRANLFEAAGNTVAAADGVSVQAAQDMREEMRSFLQDVIQKLPDSPRNTVWERNGVGGRQTLATSILQASEVEIPWLTRFSMRRAGAAFSRMAIRPLGANGMGCCIPLKPCREVADRRLPEWIAASVGHQSFVHFNNPKYAYWRHEARAAPHVDTSRCMFLHRAQQDPVLRSLDDAAVATGCSLLLTSHGPRFGSYQPRRLRPSSGLSAV